MAMIKSPDPAKMLEIWTWLKAPKAKGQEMHFSDFIARSKDRDAEAKKAEGRY